MSGDGYPYGFLDEDYQGTWPVFDGRVGHLCSIDYDKCFRGANLTSASQFFKHIAFNEPVQCGDCSKPNGSSYLNNLTILSH